MTVNNKKDVCQRLYEQYTELVKDMRLHVQVSEKKADPKYIKPEYFARREEMRLQLLDCKDCLKLPPREWFKIEKR